MKKHFLTLLFNNKFTRIIRKDPIIPITLVIVLSCICFLCTLYNVATMDDFFYPNLICISIYAIISFYIVKCAIY